MERIFFVKNGELSAVNNLLQKGAKIKTITPVAEPIAAYGYGNGAGVPLDKNGYYVADIYAYIVVELD